jgi:hypothetical protein
MAAAHSVSLTCGSDGVVRDGQDEPEQADDRTDQPLGLSQRQPEDGPERERRQHRQQRIPALSAGGRAWLGLPGCDRLVREPPLSNRPAGAKPRHTRPSF